MVTSWGAEVCKTFLVLVKELKDQQQRPEKPRAACLKFVGGASGTDTEKGQKERRVFVNLNVFIFKLSPFR